MVAAFEAKLRSAFETYRSEDARLVREVRLILEAHRAALLATNRHDGAAQARELADAMDVVLRTYHGAVPAGAGLALLALGGYGRGELSPHSDVDVLVLYPEGGEERVGDFAGPFLSFLWDLGLTVGHATRTPTECREAMDRDLPSATSLLEGRLAAGSRALFRQFTDEVAGPWLAERGDDFIEKKIDEVRARHDFYGNSPLLSVPNVKESAGGLRDLHVSGWIALALSRRKDLTVFTEAGLLTVAGREELVKAYSTVHAVRHALHATAGRKQDVLDFAVRSELAEWFGVEAKEGFTASERLMRRYYLAARSLYRFLRRVLRFREWCPATPERRHLSEALTEVGGEVYPAEPGAVSDPRELLTAVAVVAERDLHPARELIEAAAEVAGSLTGTDRAGPELAERFLRLLRTSGAGKGLRMLDEAGFLGEYLPEFGRISCLSREDPTHQYTVDEHTLRAVEALDELAARDPSVREELGRVDRPDLLRLVLLLHDIGKAGGRDHAARGVAMIPEITSRLGLSHEEARLVRFLVERHITMTELVDSREPGEAAAVLALEVPDRSRLRSLFLLTLADVAASGRGALSGWREAQLRGLYAEALAQLSPAPARPFLARVLDAAGAGREEEVREHLHAMGARYSLEVAPSRVALHLELAERLAARPIALAYLPAPAFGEVWVGGRDVPGLFAWIAGVLTLHDLDIQGAHAYTRADGLALDGFYVTRDGAAPPEEEALWREIGEELCHLGTGGVGLDERLASHRGRFRPEPPAGPPGPPSGVRCSNRVSDRFTLVEVTTRDRPGLLHDLAAAISRAGLTIHHAVIATKGGTVQDTFYVSRPGGGRPEEEEAANLLEGLGAPGGPSPETP